MPVMDGLDASKAIREVIIQKEVKKKVAIFGVTAYST